MEWRCGSKKDSQDDGEKSEDEEDREEEGSKDDPGES